MGPVVGELLYILVKSINAQRVLELGTASGYSAVFMAEAMSPEKGKLVTIDKSANMAQKARKTLEEAGLGRSGHCVGRGLPGYPNRDERSL